MDNRHDKPDKSGRAVTNFGTMYRAGLSDLDAVIAVARRASFRRAALDLGVSTTALSNAVAKLEASLGVRLFNRTTRSVSLTDAGRTFVQQVGPALQDIHGAMDLVRGQQATPSGVLRINAFATAAREVMAPLILEYVRRYPDVHVDLVTEGRLVDVVAEGFDLGLRVADLAPSDMIAVPVGPALRYVVVGAPRYFETRPAPQVPGDLLDHACVRIRLPNGALFRWPFEVRGETVHVDVTGPLTLDEAGLSRMAVLEGVALGFFMEPDVRSDIAAGRLVSVLDSFALQRPPLCLYYPGRKNPSAAFKAFIALAREVAGRSVHGAR
jgi:DNA-binding transcriptional LysR family regulator